MNFRTPFIISLLLASSGILAQGTLTAEEAINLTLENNFGIEIARQNIQVAANNATKTAVGFGPTLDASANTSLNLGGSSQQLGSGQENKVSNAFSYGGNASINGAYTLYDKQRNTTLEQLKEVLNFTNLQLRQTIESNVMNVITSYYDVARLTADIYVLDSSISVSNKRLERVQYQYEYGQGLKLDILNAQVDVQRDSINYFNALQALANAKRNLNVSMGTPIDNPISIDTTIRYEELEYETLRTQLLANNINLLLVEKDRQINQYDLSIIEDQKKPTIGATGAYNYSVQDNAKGSFITSSTSRGLNLGVNLRWNLFDGGLRKVRKQNTEIALHNLDIQKEQITLEIERDLANAWETYQNALYILGAEKINLNTSQLNFERTEEQFNLGQSSSVEFRQAQLNLLNAATNYNNAKYDAKVLEISLQQIAGNLLSN